MLILVGPIIISFAIWGIGDIFRGRTSNAVATVGDLEISATELSNEFRDTVRGLQTQFGGSFTAEQARDMGFVDYALETLVTNRLYDLEAESLGLAVGDDLVRRQITAMPSFWNVAGEFDPGIFAAVLASLGRSEQQFVETLRGEIRRAQLRDAMGAGAEPPDAMIEALFRYRAEERIVQYFVLPQESAEDVRAPEESELVAFHEENAARFTAPEYRSLVYLYVTAEDLADEIAVPQEEIAAEYADRLGEFVDPERRAVEQIVLDDEAAASRAYDRITAGEEFLAVAADMTGLGAEEVGLGMVTRDDLLEEVAGAVFSLDAGSVSRPVESPFGWHVFRVTEIVPETVRTIEEVHDEIEHDVALRLAIDALYQLGILLDDTLAGGATIEETAEQLSLPLSRVAAVDASGRDEAGEPVAGLPESPGFLDTAFSIFEGERSLLTETPDGAYYVVRADSITPPALRPLDTVRDEVVAGWRAAEQARVVAGMAAAAAEAINAGASIAKTASDLGVETEISAPLRRDGESTAPEFSRELVSAVFSAKIGDAVVAATPNGKGQVVARLSEITRPDPAASEGEMAQLRDAMAAALANDLDIQYRLYLERHYPVERFEGAIRALF